MGAAQVTLEERVRVLEMHVKMLAQACEMARFLPGDGSGVDSFHWSETTKLLYAVRGMPYGVMIDETGATYHGPPGGRFGICPRCKVDKANNHYCEPRE